MDGGPEPEDMGMPQKGSSLACNSEVVHIVLPWLDRALCDVCRSIRLTGPDLSNSMPANTLESANESNAGKDTYIEVVTTNCTVHESWKEADRKDEEMKTGISHWLTVCIS